MAKDNVLPICQDTGMPTFLVHTPVGVNQLVIKEAIHSAIAEATRIGPRYNRAILRQRRGEIRRRCIDDRRDPALPQWGGARRGRGGARMRETLSAAFGRLLPTDAKSA